MIYNPLFKAPSDIQGVLDHWAAKNRVFATREEKGDYVIALDIPACEEKSVVVNAIVDQLEDLYRQLPIPDQAKVGDPELPEVENE